MADKKRPWRKAARQIMREATIEEARRRFGTAEPLFNYRWEHVQAVYRLAMKLAAMTGADVEVVEAAVWLHDVAKNAGEDHPQAGAAFARKFLPQTDFPAAKIDQVAQAIEDHMGLWRDEPLQALESQVLWDADKLAKLGLTAAFHWLGIDFAKGKTATTRGLIENGREVDWLEKTVASMHFPAAREAAAGRRRAFDELWNRLEAELEGEDLDGE
jgi:uncharacterized protein